MDVLTYSHPKTENTVTIVITEVIEYSLCIVCEDGLVLSEFINTYARLAYNKLPQATRPAEFNSFRNSDEFLPVSPFRKN